MSLKILKFPEFTREVPGIKGTLMLRLATYYLPMDTTPEEIALGPELNCVIFSFG